MPLDPANCKWAHSDPEKYGLVDANAGLVEKQERGEASDARSTLRREVAYALEDLARDAERTTDGKALVCLRVSITDPDREGIVTALHSLAMEIRDA